MWNSLERLFGGRHVLFFGYARAALLHALDLLGLQPGENVLVPAYICDSVMSPFHYRGITVVFYPVRESLQADLTQAESLVTEQTRAFLAVNYFGFAQDYDEIKAFCRAKGLALIEDNAHGFLSGDGGGALGRHGDVAVCSFRKSLLLPDGAALVLNDAAIRDRARTVALLTQASPRLGEVVRMAVKALDLRLGGHLLRLHRSRLAATAGDPVETDLPDEEFDLAPYMARCSRYSRSAVRLVNIDRFRAAARERFACWLDYYRDDPRVHPLWRELPAGTAPWVFPFRVDDPQAYIRRIATETGARAWPWPRLLPQAVRDAGDVYPSSYRQVVAIPLGGENARLTPAS